MLEMGGRRGGGGWGDGHEWEERGWDDWRRVGGEEQKGWMLEMSGRRESDGLDESIMMGL